MFDVFKNRLELTGTLTTVTALRISQGRSLEPIGSDLPVVKDALGQPLIPGSSFKGALRSRLESFLRGITPSLANDPSQLVSRDFSDQVKELKEAHKDDDASLTVELENITDAASKVFGAPWQASKFQVRDLTVKSDTWFGQYQERDGVSIDRDTETAADGRLYDFQVVPAGVQFEFKAIFENADTATIQNPDTGQDEEIGYWELGLLMVGLQQFKMQQIPLGGGCSRGLGIVELDINKVMWVDPEEDPTALLTYMQHLATGDLSDYERVDDFFDGLKTDWTRALVSYLSWKAQNQPIAAVEA
ncbi:CRISPR-associated RAMP protein [Leptolyngbya cf. ectocarpi LEGE 11479]|uniref:CRISPR-associated RAMP protein n=1 Tax=Leptolyngbya cf. ectocarpi LEGE 11479 TaxID=1828722 RepID=A0A928ZU63_LEPEC|nr:CRISPR-associated RAMP protein Csx7 [Leptolyngbya ectocarpi]MBE9067527.1 CRISPR-associated RAMP protein [Leptolyngbya cf. ectocarpi LEGE 11479]